MQNKIAYFLLLVTILVTACSVPTNFYIRNTTTKPIKVGLVVSSPNFKSFKVLNKLITPKLNSYQSFTDTLKTELTGKDTINVSLPPQSTCLTGSGINFRVFGIKTVILYEKKLILDMISLNEETFKLFQTRKGAFWYDL